MFKPNKIKSRTKMFKKHSSRKSIKSDNLSLSTSNVNSTGYSTRKSKYVFPTISSATSARNYEPYTKSKQAQFIMKTPNNAAVHFGNFYNLGNNMGKVYCKNHWSNFVAEEETAAITRTHRSEFTRQMVHKLERITDTEDYARQLSTLLKETIEPPNFRLNPFLYENSIPDGSRRFSDYPLWYKEPHKIPLVFSNPINST